MIRRGKDIFVEIGILALISKYVTRIVDKAISKATLEQKLSEDLSLFGAKKKDVYARNLFSTPAAAKYQHSRWRECYSYSDF